MAKTIQVFVNTGNEDTNQAYAFVQDSGDKGKPTRIKAVKGARYQLKDPALKDVGPEYIRSKRVNKIPWHLLSSTQKLGVLPQQFPHRLVR